MAASPINDFFRDSASFGGEKKRAAARSQACLDLINRLSGAGSD
jgi:hypothetical protein